MLRRILLVLALVLALTTACEGVGPNTSQTIPTADPGSSQALVGPAVYTPVNLDGVGAFRTNCRFSKYGYFDPIVFPNENFKGHLHEFFGNGAISYQTTTASLTTTGGSTCTGGTLNRSGYWAPGLIDTGGNALADCLVTRQDGPAPGCRAIFPGGDDTLATDCAADPWTQYCVDEGSAMQAYYKTGYSGVIAQDVQAWPAGLRMIAGSMMATPSNPQDLYTSGWVCKNHQAESAEHYTNIAATGCQGGQLLGKVVGFPQCWDGVNLDSPDHKSHMARPLGWPDLGCPESHPVALPELQTWVYYRLPAGVNIDNLRLASDTYDGPGGFSNHSDWWNGWDPATFQTIVNNCYQPGLDCRQNLLGDGRELLTPPVGG